MLRVAKLSLLLAPLFVVPLSGCATPRATTQSTVPVDSQQARLSRLMSVAEQYEKEGKPEAAMRLYDHVLAQQPTNAQATERRNLLVEQGVKSSSRSLKPETSEVRTPTALASRTDDSALQPPPTLAPASQKKIAETPRQPASLADLLDEKSKPAQESGSLESLVEVVEQPAQDRTAPVTAEAPVPSPESMAQQSTETSTPQKQDAAALFGDDHWKPTQDRNKWKAASRDKSLAAAPAEFPESDPFVSGETAEESAFREVVSSGEGEGLIHVKPNQAGMELADRSPTKGQSAAEGAMDSAARTVAATAPEFPKPVVETKEVAPVISPANAGETGKLLALCENLPAELVPLVTKLESADPAVRLEGLKELGELQNQAQAASVAVYSLMSDANPQVAVNAAGTLRQITGDAWSVVHALSRYLDHENPEIVQLSAYLLGQIGPEAMDAVPALEQVRDTSTGLTGLYAAEALTRIAPGDRSSVMRLTQALSDSSSEMRWFAAVSLGTVAGDCEGVAVEALRKALQDQTSDVRVAACLSLGGLGDHAQVAIPDLKQAAQTGSPDVKSAAETALVCLGG